MNVLQRQMFQMPKTNEPMGGITSGLDEAEAVQSTEALGGIASGIETLFQNIDNAENPKEIMDAIRGDEASVEERRTELGQLVGKADADKTPESVLTIVQPLMTVIESTGGIASLDTEDTPVAPNIGEANQAEAMARMMQNEPTAMLSRGFVPNQDNTVSGLQALQQSTSSPLGVLDLAQRLAPQTPSLASFQKQYEDKPSAYAQYADVLPYQLLSQFGQIVGRSPTLLSAALDPQTVKLADPVLQLNMLQAKEKADRSTKATEAFTEAKRDAQKAQSDLYGKILPKFLDRKSSIFEAKDGSLYQVSPEGTPTLIKPGQDKTVIVGNTLLRLDPTTNKFVEEYSKPGSELQLYSTPKGQFAIDLSSKKADGSYNVSALPGGQTSEEISAQFFKFYDTGDGGGFAIDTRRPTIEGPGGSIVMNTLFERQGRDKTNTQSTNAGLMVVNETNPEKSFLIPDTAKKEFIKIGTKETGFRLVNKFTGVGFNVPGLKEFQPEYFDKLDRFTEASKIINNPDQFTEAKLKKAQLEVNALSKELLPANTEFEKLRDDNANLFRAELMKNAGADINEKDIDAQVDQFIFNLNNDRITKLTTNASQYDTQKSLKDTYSKMLGKLQEDTSDRVQNSLALKKLANLQSLVANETKTGSTAPFRLAVGKFLKDVGIEKNVINALGISQAEYNDFVGGKLANLELASKIGSQFAVEFASSFPGNLNQSEVDLIQNAGINLTTTREGIKVMEDIFKAEAKRNESEEKLINDYMANEANSSKTPMKQYAEIQAKLIKNRKDNPLITPEIKEKISGFTAESPNVFRVEGTNQTFSTTPDRIARFNIVKSINAPDFQTFLEKSAPMQDYARKTYGENAKFNTDQLQIIYNRYQPLTLRPNPNFRTED